MKLPMNLYVAQWTGDDPETCVFTDEKSMYEHLNSTTLEDWPAYIVHSELNTHTNAYETSVYEGTTTIFLKIVQPVLADAA